jgi:hypothetical protein
MKPKIPFGVFKEVTLNVIGMRNLSFYTANQAKINNSYIMTLSYECLRATCRGDKVTVTLSTSHNPINAHCTLNICEDAANICEENFLGRKGRC